MYAYIKTRAAFRTVYKRSVLDYSLVLDSLESAVSRVQLQGGDIPRETGGSFLSVGSQLCLISAVSPEEGVTDLQLLSPVDLFTRPRPYVAPAAGSSIGAFIARELAEGWRDEPDGVYAMPYLAIENDDASPFVAPACDDNGFYILADYMRTVRAAYGVETVFSAEGDSPAVRIRTTAPASHALVAGDGHTALVSNTYSRTAAAKVTTVQPVDTGELDPNGEKIFQIVSTNWFLAADGSVGSQEPAGRAFGEWQVIPVSDKKSAAEAAQAVFDKNGETHKVEFYSDFRLGVRDRFRLRLPSGAVFEGTVSSVSRSSGDRRWLCQAGSLATTLTDKVRKTSRSAGSGGSSGGGTAAEIYAVGDIYITTRAGDPADLLGYGAWDRIQGRFLFAADPSHPPGTRGGALSHALSSDELPSSATVLDLEGISLPQQGSTSGTAFHMVSRFSPLKTKPLGQGQSFSLMPPYVAVYVWVRKA